MAAFAKSWRHKGVTTQTGRRAVAYRTVLLARADEVIE
jgi:hypothetical protein